MTAYTYCEQNEIFVEGEMNFSTVTKIWKDSLSLFARLNELHFNFSKVTGANSAAVALLIEWLKYAKRENKPIFFMNIPKQVLSLATISGIDKILVVSN